MMILLQMSRLIDIYIYFSLAPSFLLQKKSGISCEGISLTAQTPALLFGYPVWFQGQGLWSFILIHSGHWCGERSQADHQHVPPRAHLRSAPSRRPAMPGALPCSLLSELARENRRLRTENEGGCTLALSLPCALSPKWMKNVSLLL